MASNLLDSSYKYIYFFLLFLKLPESHFSNQELSTTFNEGASSTLLHSVQCLFWYQKQAGGNSQHFGR